MTEKETLIRGIIETLMVNGYINTSVPKGECDFDISAPVSVAKVKKAKPVNRVDEAMERVSDFLNNSKSLGRDKARIIFSSYINDNERFEVIAVKAGCTVTTVRKYLEHAGLFAPKNKKVVNFQKQHPLPHGNMEAPKKVVEIKKPKAALYKPKKFRSIPLDVKSEIIYLASVKMAKKLPNGQKDYPKAPEVWAALTSDAERRIAVRSVYRVYKEAGIKSGIN